MRSKHLQYGAKGYALAFPICGNGRTGQVSGGDVVGPKEFEQAIAEGNACELCVQIYKRKEVQDSLESVFEKYRKAGFTEEKDFAGEYRFFFNPSSLIKVRVYYNGFIDEYR